VRKTWSPKRKIKGEPSTDGEKKTSARRGNIARGEVLGNREQKTQKEGKHREMVVSR